MEEEKPKKNLFASAAKNYTPPETKTDDSEFRTQSKFFRRLKRRGFWFHRKGQFVKPKDEKK